MLSLLLALESIKGAIIQSEEEGFLVDGGGVWTRPPAPVDGDSPGRRCRRWLGPTPFPALRQGDTAAFGDKGALMSTLCRGQQLSLGHGGNRPI